MKLKNDFETWNRHKKWCRHAHFKTSLFLIINANWLLFFQTHCTHTYMLRNNIYGGGSKIVLSRVFNFRLRCFVSYACSQSYTHMHIPRVENPDQEPILQSKFRGHLLIHFVSWTVLGIWWQCLALKKWVIKCASHWLQVQSFQL